jgi:anti-sigma-K factor RskA
MEKVAHPNDVAPAVAPRIIAFSPWVPYAVAIGLMILGISLVHEIIELKSQLATVRADAARLRASNALTDLRLATLDAKDAANNAAYTTTKIIVAWDSYSHRGDVALQNLPPPPTGQDYQLWVLDPGAETPISAGLIAGSKSFTAPPVSTPNPGFAISLEPAGGSPAPTGPILFAVAPGP